MKNRGLILLLALLALFSWRLEASDPALGMRLLSTHSHSFNEASDGQTWIDSYHYAPGSFAVVDSMIRSLQYGMAQPIYTTFTCQTAVSYPAPGHHRFDFSYYRPDGALDHSEGYETDVWGRKVFEYKGSGNDAIFRYYPDEPGWKADSLVYRQLIGSNYYQTKFVYEYDTQGRRVKGHKYSRIEPNPWAYEGYYQNTFDGPLPYPIDTEQRGYSDYRPLRCLAMMLDQEQRISLLAFYPVIVEPTLWNIAYHVTEGNFSYDWERVDAYSASYEHLGFYPSGKLRHYHESSGDDWTWSGSDTYDYWEEHPLPNSDEHNLPAPITLLPKYPNPFNPYTTISFHLAQPSTANLSIYNSKGQLVKTLLPNTALGSGEHRCLWDGKDEAGRAVATGLYRYRLQAGKHSLIRKMLLVK